MRPDLNTALARTLVDELARAGVREACVSPGSRSAPLALALAGDDRIRVRVLLDERSAGFFALGTARATGVPAVVVCTSGTAAAELHPAVLEASHGRVPLLVCTADRPAELRGTGAPQSIDQRNLFGTSPRWFVELTPEDRPDSIASWRPLAARAFAEAVGSPPGPVHLNVGFPEPLVPTGADVPVPPGREGGRPWSTTPRPTRRLDGADLGRLAEVVDGTERGLVVAGWGAGVDHDLVERFATFVSWPVLADPLSGLRELPAISTYEALLRQPMFAEAHRPDLVIRLGGPPTSRTLTDWLDPTVPLWLVDTHGVWLDPGRTASEHLRTDADVLLHALIGRVGVRPRSAWLDGWRSAERSARAAVDELLDGWDEPFEGRIARDLVAGVPEGTAIVAASSMPVRDIEWFAAPRRAVRFVANRGVNGIDGFVSTALGFAGAADGPVVALCGDLSFLHDSNGLLGATRRGIDLVIVVVDNGGGGIFSFLPVAEQRQHFEELFATPQDVDVLELATVHGLGTAEVDAAADLVPTVEKAMADGGVQVIRVRTDRDDNVTRHRQVWEAVAAALA